MSGEMRVEVRRAKELHAKGNLKWNDSFEAEITNASDAFGRATLFAQYDETLGRYACTSISVDRVGEGAELTGAVLRDVRIAEIVQRAALENIWVDSYLSGAPSTVTINGEDHTSAADALAGLKPVSGNTTDSDAGRAMIAYAIAQISGLPPLKTIGQALSTSQSTAKRLVARARELGYIDG